ncbi:MAG: signal peptide peptidase SppA [Parvularculaceae bacterium]
MSEEEHKSSVWGFIKGFGKLLIGILLVLQGIVGLALLLVFVGFVIAAGNTVGGQSGGQGASVPSNAALVINPEGVLVEEAQVKDPLSQLLAQNYGGGDESQVEVGAIARAIRAAEKDKRIKGLVLDLARLQIPTISASKAHYLAGVVDEFKKSGKKVYSVGDSYSQEQYIIASHADEIYMHDKGALVLIGYGSYDLFLKSFLEKMLVTPHVFRVGAFKAAVEPFLRDDMSPEAREANLAFLGGMWKSLEEGVAKARGLSVADVDAYANNLNAVLRQADGNLAEAALNSKLIDKLASRPEQLKAMQAVFGADKKGDGFNNVGYQAYLTAVGPAKDGSAPNVGIVTVSGTIVDGEAPSGVAAGGDTIAGYLKKALDDDQIKAVVLRVDSPGGSVFASEVIRDGVLALKNAGKPVVVSMGSLAASGGYWVSTPGDEIWASPTTVTGSIGIFAFFPTFEKAAAHWGVNVDGVGTTPLASLYGTGVGPLEDNVADIFQQSVERGYRDFIDVVSKGRNLDPAYVDSIAQGRVWIGSRAEGLKLVDHLGTIDDAVASAAKLANLTEYDRVNVRERLTPFELLFGEMASEGAKVLGMEKRSQSNSVLNKVIASAKGQAELLNEFNDPNALYARCISCGD